MNVMSTVTVNATGIDADHSLTFDGSALTNGYLYINGGHGNDILTGTRTGAGVKGDTLCGGDGDDTFKGSDGKDVLHGGAGTDTLDYSSVDFSSSPVTITGSADGAGTVGFNISGANTQTFDGMEVFKGTTGADTIDLSAWTSAGATILGTIGNDVITGGVGTDILDYSAFSANLTIAGTTDHAGTAVFTGGSQTFTSFEVIKGGAGNDEIDLHTWTSDATIHSGAGNDNILGGSGNDHVYMGSDLNVTDSIDGGDGMNTLHFTPDSANASALANVSNFSTIIFGDPTGDVTLNALTTGLIGTGDTLYLDTQAVTAGHSLTIDASSVTAHNIDYTAGDGLDHITGTSLDDNFHFGTHLSNADSVDGKAGDDTLYFTQNQGGDHTDDLSGVSGVEHIILGDAVTELSLDTDTVGDLLAHLDSPYLDIDGSGLTTAGNTLTFTTGDLNDNAPSFLFNVTGGSNNDMIFGGGGADTLSGGGGNDMLFGQDGMDILTGGSGADTFMYDQTTEGGATEEITDFCHADGDKLSFSNTVFSTTAADLTHFISTASYSDTLGVAGQASFIYDTSTNILHYDSNGATAGGDVAIAHITGDAVVNTDITFHAPAP